MTEERPWGYYTNLYEEEGVLIKKLVIKPQQAISLQYHNHRIETWTIIQGQGQFTIGNTTLKASQGKVLSVKLKEIHRITNVGRYNLEIIEVQLGNPREDDIVRLKDNYGRA
jgi:mannose-1-phosphate guanylyltransferase / mannose-6-phosphate isomerase